MPVAPPERAALDATPDERRAAYETGWRRGGINALSAAFTDLFTEPEANGTAQEFARAKIREVVRDPAVAEAAVPVAHDRHASGTCVDIGYFETYNRENVELVDVRALADRGDHGRAASRRRTPSTRSTSSSSRSASTR